jgi:hypothetical protein
MLYSQIARECDGRDDYAGRTDLVEALNELTFDSLKLSARARAAVHDLVHVRFGLTRGKTDPSAVRPPSPDELTNYAQTLRDELDMFVGESSSTRHRVDVLYGGGSGLIVVDLTNNGRDQRPVHVWESSDEVARQLATTKSLLSEQRAQWLYFNRNLRIYEGSKTYVLKPLQRFHWTRTQAMQDAGEIISDSLRSGPTVVAGAVG